jgi:putative membrane protein
MTSQQVAHIDVGTTLAVDRTRLAYERTLMAWVRTAASLISFGFTIYKFFQYQIEHGRPPVTDRLVGPREFALIMISIGVISLVVSTIQHQHSMASLRATYGAAAIPYSTSTLVAGLFSLLGVLALVVVVFRQ